MCDTCEFPASLPHCITVFENHRKSLIQHCERSELRLHFEWTKVNQKCQKCSILASFWKSEACGQTVLPDRSLLIGQKLAENTKIDKFKMRHFGLFSNTVLYISRNWLSQLTFGTTNNPGQLLTLSLHKLVEKRCHLSVVLNPKSFWC